jgi:protein phosphatase
MLAADRTIAEAIARVTERPGAATVALCAPLDAAAARWLVAWVGDCRVYRWSARGAGQLDLLTRDDTFGHLGEAPPPGGSAHDPARMVGNGATTGANAAVHGLGRDELLCSAATASTSTSTARTGAPSSARRLSLAQRGQALVALARKRGSVDDATVLLLHRSIPTRAACAGAAAPPSPRHERSER